MRRVMLVRWTLLLLVCTILLSQCCCKASSAADAIAAARARIEAAKARAAGRAAPKVDAAAEANAATKAVEQAKAVAAAKAKEEVETAKRKAAAAQAAAKAEAAAKAGASAEIADKKAAAEAAKANAEAKAKAAAAAAAKQKAEAQAAKQMAMTEAEAKAKAVAEAAAKSEKESHEALTKKAEEDNTAAEPAGARADEKLASAKEANGESETAEYEAGKAESADAKTKEGVKVAEAEVVADAKAAAEANKAKNEEAAAARAKEEAAAAAAAAAKARKEVEAKAKEAAAAKVQEEEATAARAKGEAKELVAAAVEDATKAAAAAKAEEEAAEAEEDEREDLGTGSRGTDDENEEHEEDEEEEEGEDDDDENDFGRPPGASVVLTRLLKCRRDGITALSEGVEADLCRQAEYELLVEDDRRHFVQHLAAFKRLQRNGSIPFGQRRRPIDTTGQPQFRHFFEHYAAPQRGEGKHPEPLVFRGLARGMAPRGWGCPAPTSADAAAGGNPRDACLRLLRAAAATSPLGAITMPSVCAATLEAGEVLMPSLVASSYLHRLVKSTDADLRSFAARWPEALAGPASGTVALHECPVGLHAVLSVLCGTLRLEVFLPDQRLKLHPRSSSVAPGSALYVHGQIGETFAADPFAASAAGQAEAPLFQHADSHGTLLDQGDVAFVPGRSVMAWRYESDAVVIKHCFVDASNLNAVKNALRIEALRPDSPAMRALLRKLDDPHMDTSMRHHPPALQTWKDTLVWPPPVAPAKGLSRYALWRERRIWLHVVRHKTMPTPTAPTPLVVRRESVTLRWRSTVRNYDHKKALSGYRVFWRRLGDNDAQRATNSRLDPERHSMALEGHTDFMYLRSAKSGGSSASALPTGSPLRRGKLTNGAKYSQVDALSDEVTAKVQRLLPGNSYRFHVAYVTPRDLVRGNPTAVLLTLPPSHPHPPRKVVPADSTKTSAKLTWYAPIEDGGLAIEAYLVQQRTAHMPFGKVTELALSNKQDLGLLEQLVTESQALALATSSGEAAKAKQAREGEIDKTMKYTYTVNALLPGVRYVFRVAARNSAGTSEWSEASFGVSTAALAEDPPVAGSLLTPLPVRVQGQKRAARDGALGSVGMNAPGGGKLVAPCLGPRVAFDDKKELLTFDLGPKRGAGLGRQSLDVTAWAGHFSPKGFIVETEMVPSKPLDGKGGVINAGAARDRILLMARGAIPLRQKVVNAQRAGALGVIIYDTTGRCDEAFNQRCCPGGDQAQGTGFAATDAATVWAKVSIPHVLIRKVDGLRLQELF